MNTDPFEKELKALPVRQLPEEWREQILRQDGACQQPARLAIGEWWRRLLWPSPYAWGGIVAAWMLIAASHSVSPESRAPQMAKVDKPSTAILAAIRERAHLRSELSEGVAFAPPPPKPAKKRSALWPTNNNSAA